MKKTKLLTGLTALALVLSLGACSNENDVPIDNSGTTQDSDTGASDETGGTSESGNDSESEVIPEGYCKVWYDTSAVVITDYNGNSWNQKDLIRGFYETKTGTAISTDSSVYLEEESTVMVVAYRQITLENYEICANGEKLDLIEDAELNAGLNAYLLNVPKGTCEITVNASEKYVSVSLEENEYVDAYLYLESDPNNHVQTLSNLKVDNDRVYVHATIKDSAPEGYVIDSVISSANAYAVPQQYGYGTTTNTWPTDWLDKNTISGDFVYVNDNEMSYLIPKWYFTDNQINISFTTTYQQYAGYNFVGDWTGYEVLPSVSIPWGSKKTMSIDAYGNVTGTISSSITSISDDGTLNLADGRQLYVSSDGKVSAIYWSAYSSIVDVSDIYLFAHTTEDVTLRYYKINSSVQYIIEVFVGDESYGVLYADSTAEKIMNFDVSIQYKGSTTSLDDEDPSFDLLDADGNVIFSVGYGDLADDVEVDEQLVEAIDFLLENNYSTGALSNWTDYSLESTEYYTETGDGVQDLSRTSNRADYVYAKEDSNGIVLGNSGYIKYFYDNYLSVHDTYYDGYNDIIYQYDLWDGIDNPDLDLDSKEYFPTLDGDFLSLTKTYLDDVVNDYIYPVAYTPYKYDEAEIEGYVETQDNVTYVYVKLHFASTTDTYSSLHEDDYNQTLELIYDENLNLVSLQYDLEHSLTYNWYVGTPTLEVDYTLSSVSISRYDGEITAPDWINEVN